jgi:tagatose-1,6-bisphosphate aldolase
MKGQYRIINEIIIFTIGIAITSYVAFSFYGIQKNVSNITKTDQIESISNLVAAAIVKSAETGYDNTITLRIPKTISGSAYAVKARGNTLTVYYIKEPEINVTKQLFNINQTHNITGEIVSSSEYIEIQNTANNIKLKRVKQF